MRFSRRSVPKGFGQKKNRYRRYFKRGYQAKRRSRFWSLGVLLVIEKLALGSVHLGYKGNGLHSEGSAVRACALARGVYNSAQVRARMRERGHPGHGELIMCARAQIVGSRRDLWDYGPAGLRACGPMGLWAYGAMGLCARGPMGLLTGGLLGLWGYRPTGLWAVAQAMAHGRLWA